MPVAYKNGTAIIIKMKDIQPSPIRRDTTASATVTLASRLIHASTKNASSVARLHAGSPYRFGASASAGAPSLWNLRGELMPMARSEGLRRSHPATGSDSTRDRIGCS
jgi:hypothetical protein